MRSSPPDPGRSNKSRRTVCRSGEKFRDQTYPLFARYIKGQGIPKKFLFCEITRTKPSLKTLGIEISVSYAKIRMKAGKPKKPPYFACCYNVGNLGDVNIVAFYHPLIAD